MNFLSKSSGVLPFVKASSPVVFNSIRSVPTPVILSEPSFIFDLPEKYFTNYSLSTTLPTGRILAKSGVIGGFTVKGQFRAAHTDVKVPNFDFYRRSNTKDPAKSSKENEDTNNLISYIPVVTAGVISTYSAKCMIETAVAFWQPTEDALACGTTLIKLNMVPEGKSMTFKWRGRPVFVKHRTKAQIEREAAVPMSDLRDPQEDSDRVQRPEWLVVVGVCTHLGCVPIADSGDYYGYYCPCHGSHYDGSGRIRRGPAPTNLEVPPYIFEGDETLVIG